MIKVSQWGHKVHRCSAFGVVAAVVDALGETTISPLILIPVPCTKASECNEDGTIPLQLTLTLPELAHAKGSHRN